MASRGSGKSFLSAIDTHLASRFNPRHGTRILGGSLSQSRQIYAALEEVVRDGRGILGGDGGTLESLLKTAARYRNGSTIEMLAASPTSVRGPHVPSLKLDEVDEIDPEIREAAMGMAMEKRGCTASVLMTSTWHRVAGPMAELIDRGRGGAFPVDTYCVFEVLERCPEERSGPRLERCHECPLVRWCHADRDSHPTGLPKAKRSDGHYTIDSLIQKVNAVSARVFESDYLCLRPRPPAPGSRRSTRRSTSRPTPNIVATWACTWRSTRACTPAPSGSRSGRDGTAGATGSTCSTTISPRGPRPRPTPRRSWRSRPAAAASGWPAPGSRPTPPAGREGHRADRARRVRACRAQGVQWARIVARRQEGRRAAARRGAACARPTTRSR